MHLLFLFLKQNYSLIEYVKKGDVSGIKDALDRGADVNTTDGVSLFHINVVIIMYLVLLI